MKTYIKAKLKKSDDQTNIDKYRVAANITEYHIISRLRKVRRAPAVIVIKEILFNHQSWLFLFLLRITSFTKVLIRWYIHFKFPIDTI